MTDDRTIIAVDCDGTVDLETIAKAVDAFRAVEELDDSAIIDVLLTDDATVAELNERYRNAQGPTDVLAFETAWPQLPRSEVWSLGQVVISCDRAAAEAIGAGVPIDDEIAWLLVHGLLHLVGYTHDDETSADAMDERTSLILKKAFDV